MNRLLLFGFATAFSLSVTKGEPVHVSGLGQIEAHAKVLAAAREGLIKASAEADRTRDGMPLRMASRELYMVSLKFRRTMEPSDWTASAPAVRSAYEVAFNGLAALTPQDRIATHDVLERHSKAIGLQLQASDASVALSSSR